MPDQPNYWHGLKNYFIRIWYYLNRGMDFVNQFRNLFFSIFAAYMALKLTDPMWMVIMLFVISPILVVFGYIQTHHLGKVLDWLNVHFSTHYGKLGYTNQDTMIKLLEEILTELKELKNGNINTDPS